jgi:hypothetical protein
MTFEYAFPNGILKGTNDDVLFDRESFLVMDVLIKASLDVHMTRIAQMMDCLFHRFTEYANEEKSGTTISMLRIFNKNQ